MNIRIEFDLDEIYADEFRPIFDQPILKVLRDIKRAQSLIMDKISKDMETSYDFKNLTYEELYKKIDEWAIRDVDAELNRRLGEETKKFDAADDYFEKKQKKLIKSLVRDYCEKLDLRGEEKRKIIESLLREYEEKLAVNGIIFSR